MTTATDALLGALATSRRHVLSERTNDVDQVMATVSQHVCYMMPDVTSPDAELVVLTDREGVRQFYAHERTFMEVVSSTLLAELTSDWYTFLEAVSTTRQVATGTLHQNEVIVLFPVAPDGIIGEILAARRPWFDVYAGTAAPSPGRAPDTDTTAWRGRALRAHETFLDALRSGRPAEAASAFAGKAGIAVVDLAHAPTRALSGKGPETAVRRCAMVVEAFEDSDREVVLLNRVIGEWYVFAEWLVRGTARDGRIHGVAGGRTVEVRSASIFPVGDDRLLGGEQGFSVVRDLG